MNVYKEMILKGNGFDNDDLDALITKTKGEVRYNLVLIRERLVEVREVIDSEVLPIINKYIEYSNSGDKILKVKLAFNLKQNLTNYNMLSQEIFKYYFKKNELILFKIIP